MEKCMCNVHTIKSPHSHRLLTYDSIVRHACCRRTFLRQVFYTKQGNTLLTGLRPDMKMFQFALGLLMIIVNISSASFMGEEEDEYPIGVYITKEGTTVYSNAGGDFFTFKIGGQKATGFKKNNNFFLNVEGKGVQVNVVALSEFLSSEEIKKDTNELDIIKKHSQFELNYIQDMMKMQLDVKSEHKRCKNGRLILVWSFDMPKMPEAKDNTVKRQLLVTTVVRNHVLVLDGIIVNENDYDEFYSLLENCMNTVELHKTPFEPEEQEKSEKAEKVTASKKTKKPAASKEPKHSKKSEKESAKKEK